MQPRMLQVYFKNLQYKWAGKSFILKIQIEPIFMVCYNHMIKFLLL